MKRINPSIRMRTAVHLAALDSLVSIVRIPSSIDGLLVCRPVVAGLMQLAHITEAAELTVGEELRARVLVDMPLGIGACFEHVLYLVLDPLLDALRLHVTSEGKLSIKVWRRLPF